MRIVTWNINGLRAVTKRGVGDLAALLDSLQADIVCFQETKLTRAELDRDLALVDGWDSYFSHCKDRSYSGVATYCKKAATVPVAAEPGITGILQSSSTDQRSFPRQIPGCYEELCNRFTQEELLAIDLEGRCVITDHEAFILFNLYGPAITSEESAAERFAYKMQLYQALQCRMQACLAAGRSVILVGDLNICPQPIDSCDPGDPSKFRDRADKKWLSSIMRHSGGCFTDLFRHFHPNRQEVFSCWSTASGARVNNYGARIDLILLAEPQLLAEPHHAAVSGTTPQGSFAVPGVVATSTGDSAIMQRNPADVLGCHKNAAIPACGNLAPSQSSGAKNSSSLLEQCQDCGVWMEMQGSDHAPVWADWNLAAPLPTPEAAPPLSTRYLFTGQQRKLTSWLGAVTTDSFPHATAPAQPDFCSQQPPAVSSQTEVHHAPTDTASQPPTGANSLTTAASSDVAAASGRHHLSSSFTRRGSRARAASGKPGVRAGQTSLRSFMQSPAAGVTTIGNAAAAAIADAASAPEAAVQSTHFKPTPSYTTSTPGTPAHQACAGLLGPAPTGSSDAQGHQTAASQSNVGTASDSFGPQDATQLPMQHPSQLSSSTQSQTQSLNAQPVPADHQQAAGRDAGNIANSLQSNVYESQPSLNAAPAAEKAAATAAWSKIQSKMKAPKCKGHQEDCVIREVKKSGPNKGRLFYVCRRPDGKPPQGRCDHFEWVGNRTARGQPTVANSFSSSKRLKGA